MCYLLLKFRAKDTKYNRSLLIQSAISLYFNVTLSVVQALNAPEESVLYIWDSYCAGAGN